jgi:cell wall assembly regulator SMI1
MTHPDRTAAQRWILAVGAALDEINECDHLHLGGALRPAGSADAANLLRSGCGVRSTEEVEATLTRLLAAPCDDRAAWNLGRAVNVAGWSYLAYLLDAEAAWGWMKKAAASAQASMSSWEAFGESYLRGPASGSDEARELQAVVERLVASKDGPWSVPWETPLDGAQPPVDTPRTLVVQPGAKHGFATIAAALEHAQDGDRIAVHPGTYAELLSFDKSVEVVAEGEVLLASDEGPLVSVEDAGVLLVGLTLRTKKRKAAKNAPTAVYAGGGFLRLERCSIRAAGFGVDLLNEDADVQLDGCRVGPCGSVGAIVEGGALFARGTVFEKNGNANLQIGGESRVLLVGSTSRASTGTGVAVADEAVVDLQLCEVARNDQGGVVVRDQAGLFVQGGMFRDNGAAHFWLGSTGEVRVAKAAVEGGSGYGVQVAAGLRTMIEGVTVRKTALACVAVGGGSPALKDSVLAESSQSGLFVHGKCSAVVTDCRIERNEGGGMETRDGADPELRGCVFAGNTGDAFLAQESGRGRLRRCVLSGSTDAGVRILTKADPLLSRCRVEGNAKEGVVVGQGGKGRFENCDIGGNDLGMFVAEGSAPVVRGGRVHGHKDDGVYVAKDSKLTIEDCEIDGNEVNLRLQAADVRVARCRVHDGRSTGIFVGDGTEGVLEDCDIYANADAGLEVAEGSDPKVCRCHVHGNAVVDLQVHDQARGTYEDGAIGGGKGWALLVEGKSRPKLRRMKIRPGAKGKVSEERGSKATLEACESGAAEGFLIAALAPKPAPTDRLGRKLARIDALLEKANPYALDAMKQGASAAALAKLAKTVFGGTSLPGEVAAFFRWHDGQSEVASLHPGDNRTPLSVAEAIEAWTFLGDPQEEVQQPWSTTWLPLFTNGAGDYLCVETAGEGAGKLVSYWHTDAERTPDVPTLEAWADATIARLEA